MIFCDSRCPPQLGFIVFVLCFSAVDCDRLWTLGGIPPEFCLSSVKTSHPKLYAYTGAIVFMWPLFSLCMERRWRVGIWVMAVQLIDFRNDVLLQFTPFIFYLNTFAFVLLNFQIVLFVEIEWPKRQIFILCIIMNNKVLLYWYVLYLYTTDWGHSLPLVEFYLYFLYLYTTEDIAYLWWSFIYISCSCTQQRT